jgi:hypothetical protein
MKFTSASSFNGEFVFVVNGWRRSGFDFGDATPQVFDRGNVVICLIDARDCVRMLGGLPDEQRLAFDDI